MSPKLEKAIIELMQAKELREKAEEFVRKHEVFLGRAIRKERIAKGMSLREMARRIDVSPSFMSDMELHRRAVPLNKLKAISRELA